MPADTVNTGLPRSLLCCPYSPFFQGIREMEIKCQSFFLLCLLFISLFCLFLENGNKEGNKAVAEEADLCMADCTVQQDMHAHGTQTRCRQDATPDFPACLCQMEPYRRHGNSGTGRMHPAVSGGIVPQPHGEPKGRPGLCPGGCLTASGCESRDRQGIPASVTLSPVYGLMGGFTAVLWPHGGPAVYMTIKTC